MQMTNDGDRKAHIVITAHTHIRTVDFPEVSNVCVKLAAVAPGDWKIVSGEQTALSAFSYRGGAHKMNIDLSHSNTFRSTSAHMWPRYVITCFTRDRAGDDSLTGYGTLFLPSTSGRHTLKVFCYIPEPSSMIQRIMARFRGLMVELVNPMMPAFADGRFGEKIRFDTQT
ncbi:unnamed protein product [Caenorhabditis bovis]|uniref:B9 domain-containing protein 1 n=1 Tax=Caenorhabditis bovis TaxID=2654633 RepID=A0A8S1ER98_9PELO|nr:unnamed protein product [Caenorhabditis bovis]